MEHERISQQERRVDEDEREHATNELGYRNVDESADYDESAGPQGPVDPPPPREPER
jgi:hypothetical protein